MIKRLLLILLFPVLAVLLVATLLPFGVIEYIGTGATERTDVIMDLVFSLYYK